MNNQDDQRIEAYMEAFHTRMAALAHAHQETFALLLEKRLTEDVEALTRPSRRRQPLLTRVGAWLVEQIAMRYMHNNLWPSTEPDDGRIIIVETSTQVLEPGSSEHVTAPNAGAVFRQRVRVCDPDADPPRMRQDEV